MNFFQKIKSPSSNETNQPTQNEMSQTTMASPDQVAPQPIAPAPQSQATPNYQPTLQTPAQPQEPRPQMPQAPRPQMPQAPRPQMPQAPRPQMPQPTNPSLQPTMQAAPQQEISHTFETKPEPVSAIQPEPVLAPEPKTEPVTEPKPETITETPVHKEFTSSTSTETLNYMNEVASNKYDIENIGYINDVSFSDVYIPFDKKTFIWGERTNAGLKLVKFEDFEEFFAEMEKAYEGTRSYLLNYKGRNYRVERTIALDGPQYIARKMPIAVPNIRNLGLPQGIYEHLASLADGCGLIIIAGATGSGKSTTSSALIKEYLQQKGGYAYTIEDPIEMPLDGIYKTPAGELGLCKQTTPPDGIWEEGIKSALRSKPRYVYLGEIRSPDVASEALRAATSGHLVLSTIHANNVPDAVNALVKYAAATGISEEMAYELVANGFLGCIHQVLEGAPKRAKVTYLFANPDVNESCQVRGMIRSGKLNLATLLEQQRIKIEKKIPLF